MRQIFFVLLVFAAVCFLLSLFSVLSAWRACKGYYAKETTKVIRKFFTDENQAVGLFINLYNLLSKTNIKEWARK